MKYYDEISMKESKKWSANGDSNGQGQPWSIFMKMTEIKEMAEVQEYGKDIPVRQVYSSLYQQFDNESTQEWLN